MKKILVNIIFIFFCLGLFSCGDFFSKYENYVTELKFEGSNYSMAAGDMIALTLNASPSDSFSYYEPEFSVSDETVCSIIDRAENQIFLKGYKAGTVIVTGKLSNKSTKCIVKVTEE